MLLLPAALLGKQVFHYCTARLKALFWEPVRKLFVGEGKA
jgi:hypothetical protein